MSDGESKMAPDSQRPLTAETAETAGRVCDICCDNFTKHNRARIVCPSCNLDACRTCTRTYLLNTSQQPHCMGCKTAWDRMFIVNATLKTFVNGAYKKHKGQLLFDQERARLAETMPAVENYLKVGQLRKNLNQYNKRYDELQMEIREMKRNIYKTRRDINLFGKGRSAAGESVREFKRKCGVDACRGFLSSAWKCGMCKTWTCPKCLEVLGLNKNCGHECEPNNVESAKLIKKDTRNCPGCATPIYKIEGCDQMWCTQCHIAFSWKNGIQVNGTIHNPHFYQWQREGSAGAIIQVPEAVICGGIPPAWRFRRQLSRALTGNAHTSCDLTNAVMLLHANTSHFVNVELAQMREGAQAAPDNKRHRIRFLVNEITEDKFKSTLAQINKKFEKNREILQIYELINTVFTESLKDIEATVQIIGTPPTGLPRRRFPPPASSASRCCVKNIIRCHRLRNYSNKELCKISFTYGQTVRVLDKDFRCGSFKLKKMKDIDLIIKKLKESPTLGLSKNKYDNIMESFQENSDLNIL